MDGWMDGWREGGRDDGTARRAGAGIDRDEMDSVPLARSMLQKNVKTMTIEATSFPRREAPSSFLHSGHFTNAQIDLLVNKYAPPFLSLICCRKRQEGREGRTDRLAFRSPPRSVRSNAHARVL